MPAPAGHVRWFKPGLLLLALAAQLLVAVKSNGGWHAGLVPCSCRAGESLDIFGEKAARRELRRYLGKGLGGDDAKRIADWAEQGGLDGATVMEVGGGSARSRSSCSAAAPSVGWSSRSSSGYEEACTETRGRGGERADQSSFVLADLLETPDAVGPVDVVVLRRVVCCSPYGPSFWPSPQAKLAARCSSATPGARGPTGRSPGSRTRSRADPQEVPGVRPTAGRAGACRGAARIDASAHVSRPRLGDREFRRRLLTHP